MRKIYPLQFVPTLKDYVWGGRNLADKLGRTLPEGIIAESWEIAAHPDGHTLVANGAYQGETLMAVQAALGLDLIGHRNAWAQARQKFPLLIKLLDATAPLSVQVHPNDEYAQAHEGNELGKTEMWIVLWAAPNAEIILGVTAHTTPDHFAQAIASNQLETHLHHIPLKAGDFVNVPAGSLHAIMGGLLIAEIQQNSNTTYRVYDWNRTGANGQKRPLHVVKALEVIDFSQIAPTLPTPELLYAGDDIRHTRLCQNRYFTVERLELAAGTLYHGHCDGQTLEIWGILTGKATLLSAENEAVRLTAVQFTLLPATLGAFTIDCDTDCTLIRTFTDALAGA